MIPFTTAGSGTDIDFLSDGSTKSLIASLAQVLELKLKSRSSVYRHKGQEVDVPQVGKELGVDVLLTGTVVRHGGTIQVSADLTESRTTPKSGVNTRVRLIALRPALIRRIGLPQ